MQNSDRKMPKINISVPNTSNKNTTLSLVGNIMKCHLIFSFYQNWLGRQDPNSAEAVVVKTNFMTLDGYDFGD